MSNDPLVKQLHDCVALAALCYEAAYMIEELSAKLEQAMEHVAEYSNDPHLVVWANTTLAELKGETK